NSNTILSEVINGEAVFVYDTTDDEKHKGITTDWSVSEESREFDFVQELLNQVIPRKRGTNYTLLTENGIYNTVTKDAVGILKDKFKIDNIGKKGIKSDFKKLMTDYNIEDSEIETWHNKIIDKKILAGDTYSSTDNRINTSPTEGDTGLFELYMNVVKVFVDAMIAEGERYAGEGTGTLPTQAWIARTEHAQNATTEKIAHGPGMAYCYGGKNDIGEFNSNVANCLAPERTIIEGYETDGIPNNEYRGKLGSVVNGGVEIACTIGAGDQKWAGLFKNEYDTGQPPFLSTRWAGIDCSGFVMRVVHDGRTAVADTNVNITINRPGNWTQAVNIPVANNAFDFYEDNNKAKRLLKKGDLIRNENGGHIAMVYKNYNNLNDARRFEIIHAYDGGGDNWSTVFPTWNEAGDNSGQTIFSRKVVVTFAYRRLNASGFVMTQRIYGRIKLW
ncbi:hypothetical protein KAJ27_15310, partial [bacterium]|nr:hypothetical protein [bacterium]